MTKGQSTHLGQARHVRDGHDRLEDLTADCGPGVVPPTERSLFRAHAQMRISAGDFVDGSGIDVSQRGARGAIDDSAVIANAGRRKLRERTVAPTIEIRSSQGAV